MSNTVACMVGGKVAARLWSLYTHMSTNTGTNLDSKFEQSEKKIQIHEPCNALAGSRSSLVVAPFVQSVGDQLCLQLRKERGREKHMAATASKSLRP